MHPVNIRHQAGGVGDGRHFHHRLGTVNKLYQHTRIHVSSACLVLVIFRHRVEIQWVVLALAGADDVVTHGGDELDKLHTG